MAQEFKKGDKVRIINNAVFVGEEGEIKGFLNGTRDIGNGPEKAFLVKLAKNATHDFVVSELEKLS